MKKIKYLMPCISLPLIAAPAITMVSCSTKTEEKKEEKFTGRVTEEEFKKAVAEIMDAQSRNKAQAVGSGSDIEWVIPPELLTEKPKFIIDQKNMLIKVGDTIIMGEYYDEDLDCMWPVLNLKVSGEVEDDLMVATLYPMKGLIPAAPYTPSTSMAEQIEYLDKMVTNFSELEYSEGVYTYVPYTDATVSVKFNKNKKIERYEYTNIEDGERRNVLTLDFTYDDVSITKDQKELLKPINVNRPNYIGDGVITFAPHSVYNQFYGIIPNYYVLDNIQYSDNWVGEAHRYDVKPIGGLDLNISSAQVEVRVNATIEGEHYDMFGPALNSLDEFTGEEIKFSVAEEMKKEGETWPDLPPMSSVLCLYANPSAMQVDDVKLMFSYDEVIK